MELTRKELDSYDYILPAHSGGKDSIACTLHLLELGVDRNKIELHHHAIDGIEQDSFMDWPCTPSYFIQFARHFGLQHYESWRAGGFYRHMMRSNQAPAEIYWQNPDGSVTIKDPAYRKRTKECSVCGELCYGCIGKFPQVTANLQQRWCSSALKIEVMERMLNNSPRFLNKRTLVITGERAEENGAFRTLAKKIGHKAALSSPDLKGRASYADFEPHRCDKRDGKRIRRHVDHWRPVKAWDETKVWEIIERHKVLVHPSYRLGWGRLSCMTCIFGSPAQWASVKEIDAPRFNLMASLERQFGCTIHRTKSLEERIQDAQPYVDMDPMLIATALCPDYQQPIITNNWTLPAGAFGESNGPT